MVKGAEAAEPAQQADQQMLGFLCDSMSLPRQVTAYGTCAVEARDSSRSRRGKHSS
jgi:hypothetical protein